MTRPRPCQWVRDSLPIPAEAITFLGCAVYFCIRSPLGIQYGSAPEPSPSHHAHLTHILRHERCIIPQLLLLHTEKTPASLPPFPAANHGLDAQLVRGKKERSSPLPSSRHLDYTGTPFANPRFRVSSTHTDYNCLDETKYCRSKDTACVNCNQRLHVDVLPHTASAFPKEPKINPFGTHPLPPEMKVYMEPPMAAVALTTFQCKASENGHHEPGHRFLATSCTPSSGTTPPTQADSPSNKLIMTT